MKLRIVLSLLVAFAIAGVAQAASVYGDFLGSEPGQVNFLNVREESVTDPTPLFGEPKAIYTAENGLSRTSILLFKPDYFASEAVNGDADTTASKLAADLQVIGEGWFLNQVIIREVGDFGMTGAGGTANIFGMLAIVDDNTGAIVLDGLDVQPDPPYSLPSDTAGTFEATVTVDLSALQLTEAELVFNNVLQTTALPNSVSFIQKKVIETTVTTLIPEPATMALLGIGGVFALLRRKRA